ncbi:Ig-like domain repeat protein [Nocardioides sp. Iso805N]|uniref:Ig-like domain repeat protein n=1 Tax=Nocardioides sp. Iso805N TaxID=1283287 RepID=UPI000365A4C7|nr:Ig-like domain repeat protein [Nocardioides sp. Iso805N]
MNRPLAAVGAVASAALALAGIQVAGAGAASANPAGTGLVISEVFTGATNAAAPYDADYAELYNPTAGALSLSGLSLQVRKADDTVIGTVPLAGSVAAGTHFLVQLDEAGEPSASHLDLPTPDATGSLDMADVADAAEVVLGNAATYGTGNLAGAAEVTDMAGFAGASSFEAAAADLPSTLSTTHNSINRADSGADTDNNATDLTWAGPTPANSTSLATRIAPTITADTTQYIAFLASGHTAWPTRLGTAYVAVTAAGDDGTPTGTVQVTFTDHADHVSNEGGIGSAGTGHAVGIIGTAGLAPGAYDVTVHYNGDATYTPATIHATVTLEAGSTASTVSAPDATVTAGQDLLSSITVEQATEGGATPTGVVSIWKGNTILTASSGVQLNGTGGASVTVPYADLAPGDNTLTVKYSGDDTYAASSSTFTVTTPAFASTTTVTAPATTVGAAGHVAVKVAATGATATGDVTLTGAGPAQTKAIDANGNVTFDLPATLGVGSYTLTASYAGVVADRVLASTGTATYKVNAAAVVKPPVVTPQQTAAQKKLAKDQAALTKAKKQYKKAHGAKKSKLKKKIAKLKKTVKKDKKKVKAGK